MPEIDLPTVIFALVALFVAFKLRSVLGTRNESGRPTGGLFAPLKRVSGPAAPVQPAAPASAPAPAAAEDRWKDTAAPEAWSGLDAVAAADRTFDPQAFLSGARAAYDMIVHAFAAGDATTLRNLMAPEAFANFDAELKARAAKNLTMTTTVVSIDEALIVAVQLAGSLAQVSVRFASKLSSVTRDSKAVVVDGSPTEVVDHIDVWTFVRDVRSPDPNWQLTATRSDR